MPHAPARPLLTGALLLGSAVCFLVTVFLFRHGIETNPFPSELTNGPPNDVRRYSGPWIAGSIGTFGVGGLLLITGVGKALRRRVRAAEIVPGPSWDPAMSGRRQDA